MNELEEKKISSELIFQGNLLDVRKDKVILPNGKISTREWINHPGAVCSIPILPNGEIVLIEQYRYAIGKTMLELPAGKLNQGEAPEKCAARELEEEIGYKAKKLSFLTNIHPAIGFANEEMYIFLAEDLQKSQTNLDSDEFIKIIPTRFEDALEMVWSGKITDVKTMIGIIWVDKVLKY